MAATGDLTPSAGQPCPKLVTLQRPGQVQLRAKYSVQLKVEPGPLGANSPEFHAPRRQADLATGSNAAVLQQAFGIKADSPRYSRE